MHPFPIIKATSDTCRTLIFPRFMTSEEFHSHDAGPNSFVLAYVFAKQVPMSDIGTPFPQREIMDPPLGSIVFFLRSPKMHSESPTRFDSIIAINLVASALKIGCKTKQPSIGRL